MGIGLGVLLLVVGAIFKFTGLDVTWFKTNLDTVGIILMAGGALALIMGVIQNGQRSRSQHTEIIEERGGGERRGDGR